MTSDEQPSLPLNSPLGHLDDLDKEKAKDRILEYAWTRGWTPSCTYWELNAQCFELTPESVEAEFARLDEKHSAQQRVGRTG